MDFKEEVREQAGIRSRVRIYEDGSESLMLPDGKELKYKAPRQVPEQSTQGGFVVQDIPDQSGTTFNVQDVPGGTMELQDIPPMDDVPVEKPYVERATDSFVRGLKNVGLGATSIATFPAEIVGMAGGALDYAQSQVSGTKLGLDLPARRALEFKDSMRDLMGMVPREQETLADRVNQFGGSAALPTGMLASLGKGGGTFAEYGGKLANFILPGTSKYTKTHLGANVAIPTAVDQGLDALVGKANAQTVPGVGDAQTPAGVGFEVQPVDKMHEPSQYEGSDNSPWAWAVAVGFSVAAALGVRRGIQHMMKGPGPDKEYATTLGERLYGSAVDKTRPIVDVMKRVDQGTADRVEDLISVSRRGPMVQRIQHFFETGEFPRRVLTYFGREVKMPFKPSDWFNRLGAMDQQKRQGVERLLEIRDELNQRAINVTDWINKNPNNRTAYHPKAPWNRRHRVDGSRANLMREASILERDPEILQMSEQYHKMAQTVLTYMYRRGLLSVDDYNWLKANRPHYVPGVETPDANTWYNRLIDDMSFKAPNRGVYGDFQHLKARETVGLGNPLAPSQALARYMQGVLEFAEQNEIRQQVISRLWSNPRYKKFLSPLSPNSSKVNNDNIVGYRENGTVKYWEIKDPYLAHALKFEPSWTPWILDAPRRVAQMFKTGIAAPWYVWRSLWMDIATANVALDKNLKLGYVDLLRRRFGFDPTAAAAALEGSVRGVAGQWENLAAKYIEQLVAKDSNLVALLGGRANAQRLGQWMGKQYENSTVALFERWGGGAARFAPSRDMPELKDVLDKVAPLYRGNNVHWAFMKQFYTSTLEGLHNGMRYRMVAANYRPGMSEHEVISLMQKVREGGIDFGKSGGGIGPRFFITSSEYLNTQVQSLAKMAQMAKEHPILTFEAFVATSALPWLATMMHTRAMGPEYEQHYWSMPAWWRAAVFPIYLPGRPPDVYIPVPNPLPEFAAALGMFQAGVDAVYGLRHGSNMNPQVEQALHSVAGTERVKDVMAAYQKTAVPSVPTVFQIGANLAGGQLNTEFDHPFWQELNGMRLGGAGGKEYRHMQGGVPVNVEAALRSLLGTTADVGLQMLVASIDAKQKTGSLEEGMKRAGDEFVHKMELQFPLPGITRPMYAKTNISDIVRKKQEGITELLSEGTIAVRDRDRGYNVGGTQPTQQQDMDTRMALRAVEPFMKRLRDIADDMKRIDNDRQSIKDEMTRLDPDTRQSLLNARLRDRRAQEEQYLVLVNLLEDTLASALKQPAVTIEDFVKHLRSQKGR